ncbi:MAG: hypothetical protein QUV05_23790 [Phycisphaerae bacterium]|nr:hypothetical protein [Phycisphaerae bacterium]
MPRHPDGSLRFSAGRLPGAAGPGSLARLAAMLVLACGITGCPPGDTSLGPPEEPLPLRAVIERVNWNSGQMDFLLRGVNGSAVGQWRRGSDDSAPTTSFDMKVVLLYRKPRNLYLRMEHTLGGTIEAGSNYREFWVWERAKENRYYWGEHEWLTNNADVDLPIRPDVLLDVLGVGDLPTDTTGSQGPVLWVCENGYQLVFLNYDEQGQGYISKVMEIGRREPYLVQRIVYFHPDGRPTMQVLLSDYRPVEGSEVRAPHKIEMNSLEAGNDNHMTMRFPSLKRFDQPAAERLFVSPMQKGGADLSYVRRVDGWRPQPRPVTRPAPQTAPAAGTAPSRPPDASRPSEPATQPDAVMIR